MRKSTWPGCEGSKCVDLALLKHHLMAMSSNEGKGQPVMFWAVFIILCRCLLAIVHLAYQAAMQYVWTLSTVQQETDTSSLFSRSFLFSTLRKKFLLTLFYHFTISKQIYIFSQQIPAAIKISSIRSLEMYKYFQSSSLPSHSVLVWSNLDFAPLN